MSTKNFVNFHVLISHSPSCLNRDDMNMQKTAVFGGVNRVRVSSQSLKRAMRTSNYYEKHLGQPSVRTRDLNGLIPIFTERLKDEFDPELIAQTMELFVREKVVDADGDDAEESDDTEASKPKVKKIAVAPWSVDEIRALCAIVQSVSLTDDEVKKVKEAASKQKGKKKKSEQDKLDDALMQKRQKAMKEQVIQIRAAMSKTVDIALSGRMATSGLMTSVDGALAVAHVLTTHAVEPQDVDWFTAVDDLHALGAAHLDTQQFSSGVFYRYASLNLKQLQVNMGLIEDIHSVETAESRAKALDVAKHVLHMLATVVPDAKQQTFAAHNLADYAMVRISDQPISLANAFEEPIRQERTGGFLKPSIHSIAEYSRRITCAYGLDDAVCAFTIQDHPDTAEHVVDSLNDLENWVARDGKE